MPPQSIRILIVEDNERHAALMDEQLLGMKLADPPCAIQTVRARCGEDALERVRREELDIVLLDYGLPDYDGLELLQEIRAARHELPVVFVTSRASVKVAVEAMKNGASDYLVKDEQYLEVLPVILGEVIARYRLRADNRRLKDEVTRQSREIRTLRSALHGRYSLREIVASSPAMLRVLRVLEMAIESTANVLLEGETGTGKEILARAIHLNGARRGRSFVAQNCAAIPESLLESELFGVIRGAFTGAERDRKGLFEEAHGGTLFLDEIGELPFHLQAKLLRVIQEQEIRPLGSVRVRKIDVRIIAATNLDLERAVEEGVFRKDLFYRLSVLPIHIPPLRERREDIPHLARRFLSIYTKREGKRIPGISPEAMALLEQYPWPGNVRQLENEIHRLVAFCPDRHFIGADLVSNPVRRHRPPYQDILDQRGPLKGIIDGVEARVVTDRLKVFEGNKTATAKSLGVNRETLYQKIAKHGIESPVRVSRARRGDGGSERERPAPAPTATPAGDPEGTTGSGGSRRL